ncbi:MAG: hypothetical protein Q4G27_00145 [Flavobacteriaceae bacterium]|nr:hypothetical protein [Flavobacteriaceae bacterium]
MPIFCKQMAEDYCEWLVIAQKISKKRAVKSLVGMVMEWVKIILVMFIDLFV